MSELKWSYQVKLSEIDAEDRSDARWYWPNNVTDPRPEFATEEEALRAGRERYPECRIQSRVLR